MDRQEIARNIAKDLLDNDVLDINNFLDDTGALLKCVQEIILKHLRDFIILSGKIL